MKNQNIVLDFTVNPLNNNQPLAVMPAHIAKLALCALAMDMGRTTLEDLKETLIQNIRYAKNSQDMTRIAMEFANERMLIDNIMDENWDAYAVEQPKPVMQGEGTEVTLPKPVGYDQGEWDKLSVSEQQEIFAQTL